MGATSLEQFGEVFARRVRTRDAEAVADLYDDFFQVYVVIDGLVTEIHGHDDQDSALAAISA